MSENNAPAAPMSGRSMAIAILICGATLMALSWICPFLFSGKFQWTEEQASHFSDSSAHLHELIDKYSESSANKRSAALNDEMKKTYDEVTELRGQLASARAWPDRVASWLRDVGIVVSIVGAVIYFAAGPHS